MFSITILFNSCAIGWKNLEHNPSVKIPYDSLPEKVKKTFENYVMDSKQIENIKVKTNFFNDKELTPIYNLDSATHIKHFNVSADAEKRQFWPYGDYFKINNQKLLLPYYPSHPYPFVIYQGYIFHCTEFNLSSQPYKNVLYMKINQHK